MNCLLCENADVAVVDTLNGLELRKLWRVADIGLSDTALGAISPGFQVNLHRCNSCGFRFYDPLLAGGAEFYEELMSTRAYPGNSPEFSFALDLAKREGLKRILDVGCGEGAFLDQARECGLETSGVELNRVAAEATRNKGHHMFDKRMEDITADDLDGGTDLLTLFQVIEHVPSPVDFIKDASRLIRSGGYLVFGVPSQKRMLGLLHYDPADWPPHHVSRWRTADFSKLAERAGLQLVGHGHDRLYGLGIAWAYQYHNRFAAALGKSELPFSSWLPPTLSFIYRYLGCKHYLRLHGQSAYAILRKL
jgi:SAM-dependent methyltransferase